MWLDNVENPLGPVVDRSSPFPLMIIGGLKRRDDDDGWGALLFGKR